MSPWIWAVGALTLGFIELHAPGFYLIWVAAGAGATALATVAFSLALPGQIATFAIASAGSCVAGYFVYRRAIRPQLGQYAPNQRELQIVGSRGIVSQAIKEGQGKVRLGDTVWLAEGPNLPEGTPIVVKAMRGTAVIIESSVES